MIARLPIHCALVEPCGSHDDCRRFSSGRGATETPGRHPSNGRERRLMPELEHAYLIAAGGIIAVMLAAYVYASVSEPKSFFRKSVGHVEVRDLRRIGKK
jgi:hypothetical protein